MQNYCNMPTNTGETDFICEQLEEGRRVCVAIMKNLSLTSLSSHPSLPLSFCFSAVMMTETLKTLTLGHSASCDIFQCLL